MYGVTIRIKATQQVTSGHNTPHTGADPGAPPPLTTKNEAPAPKFYKTEAPEWQF